MIPPLKTTGFCRNNSFRAWKLLIFAGSLLLVIPCVSLFLTPSPLRDPTGGVLEKTFQTEHKPLRKELNRLSGSDFFQWKKPSRESDPVLERLEKAYRFPETGELLEAIAHIREDYSEKDLAPGTHPAVQHLNSNRKVAEYLTELCGHPQFSNAFFSEAVFQPEKYRPVFDAAFDVLNYSARAAASESDYEFAARCLAAALKYANAMLRSALPEPYYLKASSETGLLFFRKKETETYAPTVRGTVTELIHAEFPQQNIFRVERFRFLREYEKIRRNGLRLFLGEAKPATDFKESLVSGGFSRLFHAGKVFLRDYFYDVDRDETSSLRLIRNLESPFFLPYYKAEKILISQGSVMSSRHCGELLEGIRKQSEAIDLLNLLDLQLRQIADPGDLSARRSQINGGMISLHASGN